MLAAARSPLRSVHGAHWQRNVQLRASRFQTAKSLPQNRSYATPPPQQKSVKATPENAGEGIVEDFRPPWVFTSTAFIRAALIPGAFCNSSSSINVSDFVGLIVAIGYAIFFHDFGPEEHVFMPVRFKPLIIIGQL